MKIKALQLAAGLLAGLSLAQWLGCGRDSAVEIHRDNQGNEHIHVDNNKVQADLHKAGQELSKDAHDLGNAVQQGAHEVDQRLGPAARETLQDAALTARVKARLIAAPDLGGIRIHVSSRDGQVTLDGTVGSAENRLDAEKITRRTDGVREVVDHLQVGSAG
ncbi:MAG TPA: BON domain-containing protein [Thermoanaerobaculia bacterium]|nr:BON domain-containing protein [Thermoanaerobaculia bacterium]